MSQGVEREIDLRHYVRTLWRKKWIALVPPVVLLVAAAVAVRFIPPKYRVASVVVYEGRQRMATSLERYIIPTSGGLDRDEQKAARMLQMKIQSSGFLEGVVRSLHLDDDPQMRAEADQILAQSAPGKTIEQEILSRKVGWLRGMISVRSIGPWTYQLSAEGSNPEFLYNLLIAINEHLFNTVRQELLSEIKAASDFSNQQMEIYKAKLEESQRALAAYQARRTTSPQTRVADLVDPRVIADVLSQTEVEIERAASEATDTRAQVRAELGAEPRAPVVLATEGIRLLQDRLASFERQLAWLLMENAWTAPAVVAQNERIAATRSSLRSELATAVEVSYADVDPSVRAQMTELALLDVTGEALDARRRSLEERLAAARRPVSDNGPAVPRQDDELTWLRQKVDTNQEIYDSFLQQITSSRITEAVESTQLARGFQIVEPPTWPTTPFAPDTRQILLASLVTGLSLGIGLVFFLDFLDHTLKDVAEIEQLLGLPILGTIPKIGRAAAVGAGFEARRRALLFTVVGVSIVVILVLFTLRRQI
jgi:uncharacterized protein involved in exopolysaccharide biosynthesis